MFIKFMLVICMFFYILHCSPIIKAASTKETDIKAVFLFNFTQFITWPDSAFGSVDSFFNICILGTNPFGDNLAQLLRNETVKEHPIKLKELNELKQVKPCHVLYVSSTQRYDIEQIFEFVQGMPILTVSDMHQFTQKGGMIGFFKHHRKMRFYIAPQSMREVQLIPNSNLLRVARIVER